VSIWKKEVADQSLISEQQTVFNL